MINVKITKRSISEDYIAVEHETGAILLPSKHVFGIFSIGIICVLLALPFGRLVPVEASPFSSLFAAGRLEQNKRFEEAYLTNNETVSEENLQISEAAGSLENYDDEIVPEALLASDDVESKTELKDKIAPVIEKPSPEIRRQEINSTLPSVATDKFYSNLHNLESSRKVSGEYLSNLLDNTIVQNQSQKLARLEEQRASDSKWYEQTVRKGDSLFKIFNYLNLDTKELKKIIAATNNDSDLNLTVGYKIQFLIDKNNDIRELALPISETKQLRFLKDDATDSYIMSKEDRLAQFADIKNANINESTLMPSYINAQKQKEQKQLELAKSQKEKELLAQKEAKLQQQEKERLDRELLQTTRPRLIIGTIEKRENFDKAARRVGLSRAEIASIKNQYEGKVNFRRLKENDSFRVLFNGIGTSASITAIVVDCAKYGTITLYRHPKNHLFYEEGGYQPTAGAFRRFPIMGQITVSSPFNLKRYHPIKKKIRPHYGVDFRLRIGTPIYAPADGVVTYASYMRGGGYTVILSHKGGYKTVYMHLSKFDVKKGQNVYIGQMIAKSGNTGNSTGPHLHYEVHVNGRAVDPLKVDLPSGSPRIASELKKNFEETVYILKTDLYKNALAQRE